MTDIMTTTIFRQGHGHFGRLWLWLASRRRRRAIAAHLDTLSDHILRDIGIERTEIDGMAMRTLHQAMRSSG